VVGLVAAPAPLQTRIMLLMPLVLVPRLLTLLPARGAVAGFSSRDAVGWPALIAAAPLVLAIALRSGRSRPR
jgi:hypothetical protein